MQRHKKFTSSKQLLLLSQRYPTDLGSEELQFFINKLGSTIETIKKKLLDPSLDAELRKTATDKKETKYPIWAFSKQDLSTKFVQGTKAEFEFMQSQLQGDSDIKALLRDDKRLTVSVTLEDHVNVNGRVNHDPNCFPGYTFRINIDWSPAPKKQANTPCVLL